LIAKARKAATVVGVDVGGTFTDLFWFDTAFAAKFAVPVRTSK
jgi:N-methylhydantoinase A/oxoprolinase/acetone carboxylase beta subunit